MHGRRRSGLSTVRLPDRSGGFPDLLPKIPIKVRLGRFLLRLGIDFTRKRSYHSYMNAQLTNQTHIMKYTDKQTHTAAGHLEKAADTLQELVLERGVMYRTDRERTTQYYHLDELIGKWVDRGRSHLRELPYLYLDPRPVDEIERLELWIIRAVSPASIDWTNA